MTWLPYRYGPGRCDPEGGDSGTTDEVREVNESNQERVGMAESAENSRRRYQGAARRDTDPRGRFVARDETARFWEKVDKGNEPGSCWVWTSALTADGYPLFRVKRSGRWIYVKAHRWSYEQANGPIPDDLTIDHDDDRCRNRACVRPDHLEAVTRADNIRRAAAWRRRRRTTDALGGIRP